MNEEVKEKKKAFMFEIRNGKLMIIEIQVNSSKFIKEEVLGTGFSEAVFNFKKYFIENIQKMFK